MTQWRITAKFDAKYPPDDYGEEISGNARVWQIIRDEATEHDDRFIDGWNKALDVLLLRARGDNQPNGLHP